MEISQHIKNLLKTNDRVILGGFGAFETKQISAKYDAETKTMKPPVKIVTFDQTIQEDAGLLAKYMAEQERISQDNSHEQISEFVKTVKSKLSEGQTVDFHDLGSFTQEGETLIFAFLTNDNLLLDSFGLPTVSLDSNIDTLVRPESSPKKLIPKTQKTKVEKPVKEKIKKQVKEKPIKVRKPAKEVSDKPKKKRKGLLVMLILIGAIGIMLTAVYFFKPDLWAKGYDFSIEKFGVVKQKITQVFKGKDKENYDVIDEVVPEVEEIAVDSSAIAENNVNEEELYNETIEEDIKPDIKKQDKVVVNPVKSDSKVSSGVNGKYYMIIGSVTTEKDAKKEQQRFSKKGISTTIIHVPKIGRYRISMGEFNTVKEAQNFYTKIQAEHGTIEAWVWEK